MNLRRECGEEERGRPRKELQKREFQEEASSFIDKKFRNSKIKTMQVDDLGNHALNVVKLPRESRSSSGLDGDSVMVTSMPGILHGRQSAWFWA